MPPRINRHTLNCLLDRMIDLQPSQNHNLTFLVSLIVQLPASDFQLESENISSSQTIEIGPLQHIPLWGLSHGPKDIVHESHNSQD